MNCTDHSLKLVFFHNHVAHIEIFTDRVDVIIDPCACSGTTIRAAANLGRKAYGFEVNKEFFRGAKEKVLSKIEPRLF